MSTAVRVAKERIDALVAEVQARQPSPSTSLLVRELSTAGPGRTGLSLPFWQYRVQVELGSGPTWWRGLPKCTYCDQWAVILCDQVLQPSRGKPGGPCHKQLCGRHSVSIGNDQHRCPGCVGGDVVVASSDGTVRCSFCKGRGCAACFNLRRRVAGQANP